MGRYKIERARYQNVGQSGKCCTGIVLGRLHSGGLDVDYHGPDTKW